MPATGGRCSPSSEICIRKFQLMPTSTPGMGPKWLEATLVQVLFLPVQAKPFPQSLVPPSFVPAANFFLAILLLPPTMSSSFLHSEQNHSSSSPSPAWRPAVEMEPEMRGNVGMLTHQPGLALADAGEVEGAGALVAHDLAVGLVLAAALPAPALPALPPELHRLVLVVPAPPALLLLPGRLQEIFFSLES